jgi:hypothetical protein
LRPEAGRATLHRVGGVERPGKRVSLGGPPLAQHPAPPRLAQRPRQGQEVPRGAEAAGEPSTATFGVAPTRELILAELWDNDMDPYEVAVHEGGRGPAPTDAVRGAADAPAGRGPDGGHPGVKLALACNFEERA